MILIFLDLLVLFGWYTHNQTLIQVSPAFFLPMQYNTALGPVCAGVNRPERRWRLAGLAFAIGGLTLVEYVFGVDLGIDQLLMQH